MCIRDSEESGKLIIERMKSSIPYDAPVEMCIRDRMATTTAVVRSVDKADSFIGQAWLHSVEPAEFETNIDVYKRQKPPSAS